VLRHALRGHVPAAILNRRKQGFGAPTAAWLRGPLRAVLEARLASSRVRDVGLFDAAALQRLITEHTAGRRDHRKLLWSLLMFDCWRDHYLPTARWS
jgi:asparagine synthase (glutamine-hydrolysing)